MIEDEQEQYEPAPTGWVQIPIMRGMFEIEPILDITDRFGGVIVGGYARYCCSTHVLPRPGRDVDIFPIHPEPLGSEIIFEALVEEFKSRGLKAEHENQVSITFNGAEVPPFDRCPSIQLIKPISTGTIRTCGTLAEVLSNFDFSVVRVALNRDRKTATAWASFLGDEADQLLRILNIVCPISSLLRVVKYSRKGYSMRPREAIKLFLDWDKRSVDYRRRMDELFTRSDAGDMTQQEIDELEKLLLVD